MSQKKYFIIIDGNEHEVSREVFKAYQSFENKIKYSEYMKKSNKVIIDEENGRVILKKSAEISLERLMEKNIQIPDVRRPSIQDFIEMKIMLNFAMKCLPEEDRKFAELHYYKGFSIQELSTILKIPISTLYERRKRILCKLNKILSS